MKIDIPTVALLLSLVAFLGSIYSSATNLKQSARIARLETSVRSLCGSDSPNHTANACAQMGLPLKIPLSPFAGLVDNKE